MKRIREENTKYLAKAWWGNVVVIKAIGKKYSRWFRGHKKMLFLISFVTCRVETAQFRSFQKGSGKLRTCLWWCSAVKQWPDAIICYGEKSWMAEVSREDGEQSDGSALVLPEYMFCTCAKCNSLILEKHRVWAVSIRMMEFAQIKEQDEQRKEQDVSIWSWVDVGGVGLISGKERHVRK